VFRSSLGVEERVFYATPAERGSKVSRFASEDRFQSTEELCQASGVGFSFRGEGVIVFSAKRFVLSQIRIPTRVTKDRIGNGPSLYF
jgi:hypothetical protein